MQAGKNRKNAILTSQILTNIRNLVGSEQKIGNFEGFKQSTRQHQLGFYSQKDTKPTTKMIFEVLSRV